MIDLHCHILPNMDDGPVSLDESLEMARLAVSDGIDTIVATPHMCSEKGLMQEIKEKVTALNEEFKKHDIPITLVPGSENCMFLSGELMKMHNINGSRYVLVEFPHSDIPSSADSLLFNLTMLGCVPIIAHPERNTTVLRDPSVLKHLIDRGGIVQITAGSIEGRFGERVMECAAYLLKKRMVHIIASDGHSSKRRPPVMSEGVKAAVSIVGKASVSVMVHTNPAKIISNQVI